MQATFRADLSVSASSSMLLDVELFHGFVVSMLLENYCLGPDLREMQLLDTACPRKKKKRKAKYGIQ